MLMTATMTAALIGCGAGELMHSTAGAMEIRGEVHGGQQPVGGSSIKVYVAGNGGNGSAALPILTKTVTSQTDGSFDISDDYTCATGEQVYLVASGGNPGLTPQTNNPALLLMTAIGPCASLADATYVEINEVTTAAAAWALAPFMKSAAEVGASSTNGKGLAGAFLHAQLLADSSTGLAAVLPANLSVETEKLYALADALAPCVNSAGGAGCAPLFSAATPSGGMLPANTLSAALNIVKHPGQNITGVFDAINAEAPFPSRLSTAPHDWTMSLTVTGGGLNSPSALGVDGFNNVWVANYPGSLSAFSAQGSPLSSTGYGSEILSEVYGLTVDPSNNVWVTNEESPYHYPTAGSVTAFVGAGSGSTGSLLNGTSYVYDASIDFPFAVAADTNGNIFVDNNANSSVTIFNSSGGFVESGVGAGHAALPVALAVDLSHGVWLANEGDNSVTHISAGGALLARATCCDGPNGVATDMYGNAWVSNFYGGSVTELSANGLVEVNNESGGGLKNNAPSGIAIDASQTVWVTNYYGANLSEVAGNGGLTVAGTAISPATGYGLDAHLLLPFAIAPDGGGNLWVSNFGNSTVTMFFGLATPTRTPLLPAPTAP